MVHALQASHSRELNPASSMQTDILFETRNHLGLITLNRPAALNSLSLPMVDAMAAQLRDWARDDSIYAVLVKGSGEKAFCAGGDIRALYGSLTTGGTLQETFFLHEYRLDYSIHRYPKPYLALMNGITMGGGMGISQGARLRIVGDRTRIAMPETGIGLFPDVGASHFLSRLPGALGTYLGLTGAEIRAADALALKLADVYLPPNAIAGLEDALATMQWGRDICADIESLVRNSGVRHLPGATLPALQPVIDRHFCRPGSSEPGLSAARIRDIMQSLEAEEHPLYRDCAESTLATLR
jgi:enoyl-CoA hydratase/carnithine racemase